MKGPPTKPWDASWMRTDEEDQGRVGTNMKVGEKCKRAWWLEDRRPEQDSWAGEPQVRWPAAWASQPLWAARTIMAGTWRPNWQINRSTRRPHKMDMLRGGSEGVSKTPQRSASVRCMYHAMQTLRWRTLWDRWKTLGAWWTATNIIQMGPQNCLTYLREQGGEQRVEQRILRQSSETCSLHD